MMKVTLIWNFFQKKAKELLKITFWLRLGKQIGSKKTSKMIVAQCPMYESILILFLFPNVIKSAISSLSHQFDLK